YFLAVLSAGIDAAIAAYANQLAYPRGPLKYKIATLRELPRFKPYGVSLEVDGKRWEQRCTLVAVANGPLFGGGLMISPESSHVDGMLDLVLAEPMRPLAIARVFPRLTDGSHLGDPRVRVVRATRVRIGPATPGGGTQGAPLPPAFADGELIGAAPLDVRAVPGALRLLGGKADSLRA
ncbi:MAG: diacylglycerol kinase family lipid kinase, partial [Demequina sp.]